MPTPDSHRDELHWMEKLAPFRHGARLLPCAWPPEGDGPERVLLFARLKPSPIPLETLCAAAFALVLGRYNSGEPLLIGVPSGHESGPGLAFVGDLPDEERDAATFLAHIGATLAESRRHPPCALDRVASGLGVDQSQRYAAFLQIGYAYGTVEQSSFLRKHAGLCFHVEPAEPGTPEDRDVRLHFHFNASQYSRAFIVQLAGHTVRAIDWLTTADRLPLRDAGLLSAGERRRIARDFCGARAEFPAGLTLHGLVSRQASRTPESIAVIHKGVELTYREIEEQSNRIANALRRDYGVQTGDIVGVMVNRSEKTVAALLGVMKAGAAYVPISPRHPWDTVSFMIENAGISVLIVDADSMAAAAMFSGQLLVVEIEWRSRGPAGDPAVSVSDADLAYVIYTSGSTGKPKGVAIEHRAIVNTILWRNRFYEIGSGEVNLQIPSFSFDSSVVDIFCVLSVGGALLIPEEDMRLDVRHLKALCAGRGVTSCIVTPSYYKLLVAEIGDAAPSLRFVTLAGETATSDLVAAHLEHLPGVALFNEYGPTENAVCSTACRLEAVEPTVSIGTPIANVELFILDAHGRLCPPGVSGEIYLGGAGLARGYVNQPELTAERFVRMAPAGPDGLVVTAGAAVPAGLYRTGDRACWRADGSIEFLGRLDSQVKVRGFRIELDEVEIALLQHAGVRNAAVLCKEDPGGRKYLAAYADAPEDVDLREHLRNRLPYYMVPDILTVLPELPLNLNGKVDRGVLRSLDDFAARVSARPAAMSPLEANLLGLSADVLHRANMTLDDNFFELGGNSLAVMELTSRIRGEMSLDVDLIDVYTCPTIRELAGHLSAASPER